MHRRQILATGGLLLAGLATPSIIRAKARVQEIELRSDVDGAKVWFDPIGVLVEPGTIIRWIIRENVHTTTAYHPDNDNHALRIPSNATAWDSGYLVNPGDHFEIELSVPGVYDYFCAPHEEAGMVGRIIVGNPSSLNLKYLQNQNIKNPDWEDVPVEAQQAFPSIEEIMRDGAVRV